MVNLDIKSNEELYDKYDEIINITMVNLYSLTKEAKKIALTGFDRENKDHLFFLRVALLAKDIYGYPLEIDAKFWDRLVLNWKMRKISRRVPKYEGVGACVNISDLAQFMYEPIRAYLGESFKFADIYTAFYGKELG